MFKEEYFQVPLPGDVHPICNGPVEVPSQSHMSFMEEMHDFFFSQDVLNKTLVKNHRITYAIIAVYLVFTKWIGPAIMKPFKPMDLRYTIRVYNLFQVVANSYLLCELVDIFIRLWPERCLIRHNPNYPQYFSEASMLIWHMYLSKLSDLIDTVFFVLRKKDSHISVLHVFHHSCMVLLFHTGISTTNIGFFVVIGVMINTGIHVIMYFYYFLSAFGPHMQKYLWWKRYLTQMQIIQFITILAYQTHAFMTGCEELGVFEVSSYIFVFLLLLLFLNFYFKSFKTKKKINDCPKRD